MIHQDIDPEFLAAVDLGSNSFHMIVVQIVDGQPRIVDRLRDRVALAAGLDEQRRLRPTAEARGLACLERFSQRLRGFPPGTVRAVGTSTFRRARNGAEFLKRATGALGHRIEILPGVEEARLVYLGVAHDLPGGEESRLVIDIGGGSTECILGRGFVPRSARSLSMGCVVWSRRFFKSGRLRSDDYDRAVVAARLELEELEAKWRDETHERCVGSSGTNEAIHELARSVCGEEAVTSKVLKQLRKEVLGAKRVENLDLPGLKADRRDVIAGGLAILEALFAAFRIERMESSSFALREGVIYDLLGRARHDDVRERTIQTLSTRQGIDEEQAQRVESFALGLFDAVRKEWKLGTEHRRLLSWAARLHEIGLSVAHSGYHKHGQYLVIHGAMPGFSWSDQDALGCLIRTHRKRLEFDRLRTPTGGSEKELAALAALLRIAVRFHRARGAVEVPTFGVRADRKGLALEFPEGWLDEHPLSRADLMGEVEELARVDLEFRMA